MLGSQPAVPCSPILSLGARGVQGGGERKGVGGFEGRGCKLAASTKAFNGRSVVHESLKWRPLTLIGKANYHCSCCVQASGLARELSPFSCAACMPMGSNLAPNNSLAPKPEIG